MCHDGGAGVTQLARVPAFQADCCGFEPRHPLHCEKNVWKFQPWGWIFLFRKKVSKNLTNFWILSIIRGRLLLYQIKIWNKNER